MFGHHVDLPSLTLSVSEGCDICELVYDIFRKTRANIYDIPFTDYVSTFCVTKGFGTTWKGGHAYRLEFYLNGAFFDDGASDGRHGSAYYECTLDIVPGKLLLTGISAVYFTGKNNHDILQTMIPIYTSYSTILPTPRAHGSLSSPG